MSSSGRPEPQEQALRERLRSLYLQLDDTRSRTLKYQRLMAEIRELAIAYNALVDAHQDTS